ncbi:MAG: tetratricopeptide repeat protein [Acidovorax sp.]
MLSDKRPDTRALYAFTALLLAAVLTVYLPGLGHDLLFDDQRLKDGSIFGQYGSLLTIKQRMISYGSFVWIDQLLGAGWWKQRLVNIALHLGVVAAVYGLLRALLAHTRFPEDIEEQEHFEASRRAALRIGVALFALSPVAVYAVGYLIQRSIVMATLFALLACWAFVRALETRRWAWYPAALACYVLAVLSKEHAVMTAALALPLYVFVRRPDFKRVAVAGAVALLLLSGATTVLLHFYGDVVGKVFDEQSLAFVQQLEAVQPGISGRMLPLSILNQAGLFFGYGLLWLVPYVGWMSVDLRPAFPLGFFVSWHALGAAGYVALILGASWLLLRRSGALALLGLFLLMPALWFATEFTTVWVQDPMVLYRSYLWAVTLPGLLAIALTGFTPRTIYSAGIVLGLLFAVLALERHLSLADDLSAWTDASEKIDLKAPPSAVGRSRAFVNLGAYYQSRGLVEQAERPLATAVALGDRGAIGSSAMFNTGLLLRSFNKHTEALKAFAAAEALGYSDPRLYIQRGRSLTALGQHEQAFRSFSLAAIRAKSNPGDHSLMPAILISRVESAMAGQLYGEAIVCFEELLRESPMDPRLRLGMGMALVGKGEAKKALEWFNTLIAEKPSAMAYYGRGLAYHQMGQHSASLRDLDEALGIDPRNPQYQAMRSTVAEAAGTGGKNSRRTK